MRNMMRSFFEFFGRDLFSIFDGRGRIYNRRERDDGEDFLIVSDFKDS